MECYLRKIYVILNAVLWVLEQFQTKKTVRCKWIILNIEVAEEQ